MGKNPLKMGNNTIFRCSKILKCSGNSRSQIVFRTDIFRKLSLGAPVYISRASRDADQTKLVLLFKLYRMFVGLFITFLEASFSLN